MNKEIICPKCLSKNIEPMYYGIEYYEILESLDKNENIYGGCFENEKTRPNYICLDCKNKFR